MPLTLDATPGGAASNAYAAVTDADTAATFRIGAAGWAALQPDEKVQALVTATQNIDTLGPYFLGDRATATQALEWPRSGTDWADDALPAQLVSATIALAVSYVPAFAVGYTGDPYNLDRFAGRIKQKTVDVLTTIWFEPGADELTVLMAWLPQEVQRLLAALMRPAAVDGWGGSAIVTRGS